ncbi:MAG: hypothetical protein ACR2PL_15575 [Dehalococcoidia bacterium]
MKRHDQIALTVTGAGLPEQLTELLKELPKARREVSFTLDELSLRLGRRLPDPAQTITFWQRGPLGRALRAADFSVRVEYEKVIFVRSDRSGIRCAE